jgi:hypothetical protein
VVSIEGELLTMRQLSSANEPSKRSTASVKLLRWVSKPEMGVTCSLILSKLIKDHQLSLPMVKVKGKDGEPVDKPICFPFLLEPVEPKGTCGCTGWTPHCKRGGEKKDGVKRCDRMHVDPEAADWKQQPKTSYESLWSFVQHPEVSHYWAPTEAFEKLMV